MSASKKTLRLPRKKAAPTPHEERVRSGARAARAQSQNRRRQRPVAPRQTATPSASHQAIVKTSPQHVAPKPSEKKQGPAAQALPFAAFAPCPRGLEEMLARELKQLGFTDVTPGRAGCHFQADWRDILRANLYSRIATRILVQLAQAPVRTPEDIYALALDTEWEKWFGARHSLRVDTSAVGSPMQSLQYCNLRVKDAICDRIRAREGARPDVDTVRPDARVHLFLDANSATLYLDSSGESLFKRGWRYQKGAAPLRENLAAGLLALADWSPEYPLVDPFCGSGTILIEAAWIALNAPPGLHRPFQFERLRNHNPRIWHQIKDQARSQIRPTLETLLIGADTDSAALDLARQNLQQAKLAPDNIQFQVANALELLPPEGRPGWVVTNPPYGERLGAQDSSFWSDWSAQLKTHYDGWSVNVISSDLGLPGHLRLSPDRRFPVFNGALDCRLFQFQIHGRRTEPNGAGATSEP